MIEQFFMKPTVKNQQRKLMRLLARETIAAMNTCNLNWCSELFIIHGVIAVLSEGSRCFRPERTMNNISSDTLNPLPWVFFLKWVYLNDCFAQQKYKYANLIFRGSQNQWQENKNRWQTEFRMEVIELLNIHSLRTRTRQEKRLA